MYQFDVTKSMLLLKVDRMSAAVWALSEVWKSRTTGNPTNCNTSVQRPWVFPLWLQGFLLDAAYIPTWVTVCLSAHHAQPILARWPGTTRTLVPLAVVRTAAFVSDLEAPRSRATTLRDQYPDGTHFTLAQI